MQQSVEIINKEPLEVETILPLTQDARLLRLIRQLNVEPDAPTVPSPAPRSSPQSPPYIYD